MSNTGSRLLRAAAMVSVAGLAIMCSDAALAQATSEPGTQTPPTAPPGSDTSSTAPLGTPVATEGTQVGPNIAPVSETGADGDILVMARRRSERSLDVPVAISAISGEQIAQQGLTNLSAIAAQVPQLKVDSNIVSFGGTLTLRGISSATSTVSIEQAVSINIDGIPLSYAGVVRLGQFDLGQVEILRGPQALFFGKNASAGIISLRSAAPTDHFDMAVRAGYEFEASDKFVEGYVSGPLTDSLRGRVAVRYSNMEGWIRNIVPAGSPGFGVRNRFAPGTEETTAKASLHYGSGAFTAKLVGIYGDVNTQGTSLAQRWVCPYGAPQGPSIYVGETDCRLDNRTVTGDLNPALNALTPLFPADGAPYTRLNQGLVSLDMNYDLGPVSFSSLTGYYHLRFDTADQLAFGPLALFSNAARVTKRSWSEEVRITSSLDGPLNFMIGLFLQDDRFESFSRSVLGAAALPDIGTVGIDGSTISPFAQVSYKIGPLSLSGGVRYTDEDKREFNQQFQALLPGSRRSKDWSPEATIALRAAPNVNIYGSYKEGYKSGGYAIESTGLPRALVAGRQVNNSYRPEQVEGFEVGAKASALSGAVRVNLAAYTFKYSDLQLGRFDPVLLATSIDNVGTARTKGIEGDITVTPVSGLTLSGSVAYNRARYLNFLAACYAGQTAALGCNTATSLQNAAGRDLPRAPRWAGTLGGAYTGLINDNFQYRLNAGLTYSDSYETMSELIPGTRQRAYTLYDAGFALGPPDDRWEVAFIGRNLGNRFYASSSGQVPLTGGNGRFSDVFTTINRGRELTVRLTLHPFGR